MSVMIDSPIQLANRHRAFSPLPGPGGEPPAPSTATPPWADEEAWDQDDSPVAAATASTAGALTATALAAATATATAPTPTPAEPVPAFGPRPAALPCDGPSVPPTRTVAPFPPIRAGGGRHRLPSAVRRRPGPLAAGLMVAVTTLAAGSLRPLEPPTTVHSAADVPRPSESTG